MNQPLQIRLSRRFLTYVGVGIVAVLVAEVLLPMEGITETDLSEIQQRLRLPLEIPLVAAFGLAEAFCWPKAFPSEPAVLTTASMYILQAFAAMACARRVPFVALTILQILFLGVAIFYGVRIAHLPSGG